MAIAEASSGSIYVESSAVLAWLFGETAGTQVRTILDRAQTPISSDLTIVECERALHRGIALGALSETAASELRGLLVRASGDWTLLRLSPAIVNRARQPFPAEPIRTLDALHIASALHVRDAIADIAILSLDRRVRSVAGDLGFELLPS